MSSDVFERNVAKMIRRSALRPDPERAKERFLRGLGAPEERRSWKLAAAAAAILMLVTIFWSARIERPPALTTGQSTTKPPPAESGPGHPIAARGGNEVLSGEFVLRSRESPPKVTFNGRTREQPGPSPFPNGTILHIRVHLMSEKLEVGRLVPTVRETWPTSAEYRDGTFTSDWDYQGPVLVHVEVLLRDEFQERDVVKALQLPEGKRRWDFDGSIWNQDLLSRLEKQYPQTLDFIRELRGLVDRVQEACASEELFKSRQKALVAEAEKIQARAAASGKTGLFPASMSQVEYGARDLAVLMPIFTWEGGKLAGPKSYHTGDKIANTFRGDRFGLESYRRYMDEAAVAAGRELLLWILRDAERTGLEEPHRKLLRDHALEPGVKDVAPRILQMPALSEDLQALEAEVRILNS